MSRRTRRQVLNAGAVGGLLAIAGCSGGGDGGDGGDGDDTPTDEPGGTATAPPGTTTGGTAATATRATTAVPTTAEPTTTTTARPTTAPPTTTQEGDLGERQPTSTDTALGGAGPRDVFEGLAPFGDRHVALGGFDTGQATNAWAQAIDVGGQDDWESTVETDRQTTLYDGTEFDGGVFAVGTATGGDESYLEVVFFRADGTIGPSGSLGSGRAVGRAAAPLGSGVLAAGSKRDGGTLAGYAVAVDESESIRWRQRYESTSADQTAFNDAVASPNGAALCGAAVTGGRANPWLVTVDEAGQRLFERTYEQPDGPSLKALELIPDGGVIAVGETRSTAQADGEGFVAKFERNGTLAWTDRVNPLGGSGALFDVVVDGDELVVAGGVGDGGTVDAYLAGYGTDGTRRWQGRWGSENVDLFGGVERISRGYLCAGLTGWSQTDGDAWLALVNQP